MEKNVKADTSTVSVEELQKKLNALSDQLKSEKHRADVAEKEAVTKVCQSLGLDFDEVTAQVGTKPQIKEDLMEYNIGQTVVAINGREFTGKGVAPRGQVEMIVQMANAKLERELKAKIGMNYQVTTGYGNQVSSRVLGTSEESLA